MVDALKACGLIADDTVEAIDLTVNQTLGRGATFVTLPFGDPCRPWEGDAGEASAAAPV